jgi:hypothetical protein
MSLSTAVQNDVRFRDFSQLDTSITIYHIEQGTQVKSSIQSDHEYITFTTVPTNTIKKLET